MRFPLSSDQRGFTMMELLVTLLIIGILVAIALPTFLSNEKNGKDTAAKVDVRNAMGVLEGCRVSADSYAGCETAEDLPAGVTVSGTSVTAYTVSRTALSGTTFRIVRSGDTLSRTCTPAKGGCRNNSW